MEKGIYHRLNNPANRGSSEQALLKKFGRTMGICLFAIGLILFFRHKPAFRLFYLSGLAFFITAQISAVLLKPVYKIWMALAFYLGWINTRIILILVYYLAVTPIGLITKILRKDLLNSKLEKSADSYWLKRHPLKFTEESYESIF